MWDHVRGISYSIYRVHGMTEDVGFSDQMDEVSDVPLESRLRFRLIWVSLILILSLHSISSL